MEHWLGVHVKNSQENNSFSVSGHVPWPQRISRMGEDVIAWKSIDVSEEHVASIFNLLHNHCYENLKSYRTKLVLYSTIKT
jgi:hypothetical protein